MQFKKLLSAIGLLAVSAPVALSVVACGPTQSDGDKEKELNFENLQKYFEKNYLSLDKNEFSEEQDKNEQLIIAEFFQELKTQFNNPADARDDFDIGEISYHNEEKSYGWFEFKYQANETPIVVVFAFDKVSEAQKIIDVLNNVAKENTFEFYQKKNFDYNKKLVLDKIAEATKGITEFDINDVDVLTKDPTKNTIPAEFTWQGNVFEINYKIMDEENEDKDLATILNDYDLGTLEDKNIETIIDAIKTQKDEFANINFAPNIEIKDVDGEDNNLLYFRANVKVTEGQGYYGEGTVLFQLEKETKNLEDIIEQEHDLTPNSKLGLILNSNSAKDIKKAIVKDFPELKGINLKIKNIQDFATNGVTWTYATAEVTSKDYDGKVIVKFCYLRENDTKLNDLKNIFKDGFLMEKSMFPKETWEEKYATPEFLKELLTGCFKNTKQNEFIEWNSPIIMLWEKNGNKLTNELKQELQNINFEVTKVEVQKNWLVKCQLTFSVTFNNIKIDDCTFTVLA